MNKKSTTLASSLIAMLALAGCQAVPQTGLVYSSTQTLGVGLKVSGTDAAAPVDVNIGFKLADVAYVPVFVGKADGSSGQTLYGTHGNSAGEVKECLQQVSANNVNVLGLRAAAEPRTADPSLCDVKRDAFSVYGQFQGNGSASAGDKSAGLLAGKVFATGVAAQHVSDASGMLAMAECIKGAVGNETDTDKRKALIDKYCSRIGR